MPVCRVLSLNALPPYPLRPMDAKEPAEPVEPVEDALREFLEQEGMDGEAVLAVLVRTLADRHVDVQLRRRGKRPMWTPGNERADAMVAAMDALHEAGHRDKESAPERAAMQQT